MAMSGTVYFYNPERGWGLIRSDRIFPEEYAGLSPDIYVEVNAVRQAGLERLEEGHRVSFDVIKQKNKQLKAIDLRPVATSGKVEYYDSEKGRGNIKSDKDWPDGHRGFSPSVIVEVTAVRQAGLERLEVGQRVSFNVVQQQLKAINLRPISSSGEDNAP
jgi:cold shock CspA family protein